MKRLLMAMMSLVLFGVLATAVAGLALKMAGVPPVVSVSCMVVLMLVRSYLMMVKLSNGDGLHEPGVDASKLAAVQVEIWANYIIGNLFKNNQFLDYCFKADQYVLQGKVVHIPQAAAPSGVEKNRSVLPASVTKRSDTDVTYALDEFTTNPRLIPHADTVELSYDKMDSVMKEDMAALTETAAENMLVEWAPTSNTLRTTGEAVDTHVEGTTGTRKAFTSKDLSRAQKMFNKQNVPSTGRYALLDSDMYQQLVDSLSEGQYRDFSKVVDPAKGVVGELFGFKIMQRSSVLVYNAAADSVRAYGASPSATDCAGALLWHEDSVERAMGEVLVFDDTKNPTYYGDIMSFLVRMGGRIRRADEKGVVAIVQDTAGV